MDTVAVLVTFHDSAVPDQAEDRLRQYGDIIGRLPDLGIVRISIEPKRIPELRKLDFVKGVEIERIQRANYFPAQK